MRWFILFFSMMSVFLWAGDTDDAYRLYKKGEYVQAYDLYTLAYRDKGNIKAAYNVAVMIEKQKVHDRNILNYRPVEAAKWYKRVADSVPKKLTPAYCHKEMYPYYLKTFSKLSDWSRQGHLMKRSSEAAAAYARKASVLKAYCKHIKDPKRSTVPHTKSYEEELADDYLKKCSAAKIIPPRDRIWIDRYPCFYYKKFPKQMKKILHLAQYERIYSHPTANNKEDEKKVINKKARKTAHPVLSYLVHNKVIPCYKKAKTDKALEKCYYNYLSDCQQLTFGDIISCTGTPQGDKKKAKNITDKERSKAIKEIKKMLKKGNICPELFLCS